MPSCEVLVSDAMYKVYWSDGEYIQGFRSDHLDPNVNLFGTPRKLIGACRPKCSMEASVLALSFPHSHIQLFISSLCIDKYLHRPVFYHRKRWPAVNTSKTSSRPNKSTTSQSPSSSPSSRSHYTCTPTGRVCGADSSATQWPRCRVRRGRKRSHEAV